MKRESGIYCIENLINGKKYIGSATNFKERWRIHLSDLRRNKHSNQRLQNSWNKYGEDSFKFYILVKCPKEYNIKLEQWFIDSTNPEYNICRVAGSSLGLIRSEETRKKISIAGKGRVPFFTQEHKDNISRAKKGVKRNLTDEERIKLVPKNRDVYFNATFKITKPTGEIIIIERYSNLLKYFNCGYTSPYRVLTGQRRTLYKHKIEIINEYISK